MAKKEDTFLLVSLKESESKKLAQVISNETSRRILAYLTNKSAAESEISRELNIPISTIHYNLQQLQKTRLVEAREFHYSKKGKEVNHYSLSKKYIIIAPKTEALKTRLRGILPAVVIAVAAAGLIHLFTQGIAFGTFAASQTAEFAMKEGIAETALSAGTGLPVALWFLFGAILAIIIYLITAFIRKR